MTTRLIPALAIAKAQDLQGLVVTYKILSGSRLSAYSNALISACTLKVQGGAGSGPHAVSQCGYPWGLPLYPVLKIRPRRSTTTAPTERRTQVDRFEATQAMDIKYSVTVIRLPKNCTSAFLSYGRRGLPAPPLGKELLKA